MIRYFARWTVNAETGPLYDVVDSFTGNILSARQAYHDANDEADARNLGTFGQEIAEAA